MIVPPAAADAIVGLRMATPVMQDACVPSRDGRRYMPRGDGQGDSPEAPRRGATGQMMAAFKLQAGTSDSDSPSESQTLGVGTKLLVNYRKGVCRPGAVGLCTSATEPVSHLARFPLSPLPT
jgi:hypothetical protein